MKTMTLIATFLAISASAAGVTALSNVPIDGADTLDRFMLSLINASVCPAAVGLGYNGGGSDLAEANLIFSSVGTPQTVGPMSRFFTAVACNAADASKAEGIAFAAEGVGIVVSKQHIDCDPNAASPGDCAAHGPTGIKNSGSLDCTGDPSSTGCGAVTANTYTLGNNSGNTGVSGWRDVLRLIYLGLPQTASRDPDYSPDGLPEPSGKRNCNSAARQSLVNNWGNLFENACAGGNCTQLNHAWRRDEFSSTADVFREVIIAKLSPFCNTRFAGEPLTNVEYPTLTSGAPIFEDEYQDFDPIRRICAGGANGQGGALPAPTNGGTVQPDFPALPAEQVCSPKGTLGLVLPIRAPANLSQVSVYPTPPCLRGNLLLGPTPKTPAGFDTLCPNGDVPLGNAASDYSSATGRVSNSSGICLVPGSAANSAQCINGRNNFPAPNDPPFVITNALRDGRVYNQHVYGTGSTPIYLKDAELATSPPLGELGIVPGGPPRSIVGALLRIHATRTLIASAPTCPGSGGSGRCCDRTDSTAQMGCLTEADPCSFGFAGGAAQQQQLQTSGAIELSYGASVNNILDSQSCSVTSAYPLARRLYLNSVIGFENVTGQELGLAKCFAGGTSTLFSDLLAANNLIPLPTGPVCQDFANEQCSTHNTPSDACANNASVGLPTVH